jgi:predicted dehydrogenase
MKKLEKVIWGIIGAGNVCEVKSAPAMYSLPNSEVKMIMRQNAEKAADFSKRHNIPYWTTDLDVILNDKDINAIYIATPPNTHAELTIKAAKAAKAVYVEKPMAKTYVECLRMIDVCQEANVPLFVAYYRRTLEGYLKVKELIDNGKIGDVRFVNIEINQPAVSDIIANLENNWRVIPEISGGGYFHDLASHQLDYLDFLFGEITEAHGISANQSNFYQADDIVAASFKFINGVIGSGQWCFSTNSVSEKDIIRIVGSKGEISFNTFGSSMIISLKNESCGKKEFVYNHSQPIQLPLIKLIVDELCGNAESPSTGISGARTSRVIDKILMK